MEAVEVHHGWCWDEAVRHFHRFHLHRVVKLKIYKTEMACFPIGYQSVVHRESVGGSKTENL